MSRNAPYENKAKKVKSLYWIPHHCQSQKWYVSVLILLILVFFIYFLSYSFHGAKHMGWIYESLDPLASCMYCNKHWNKTLKDIVCRGFNYSFYSNSPQYSHSSFKFFFETSTFDIFWQYHPNDVWDKPKNKLISSCLKDYKKHFILSL